MSALLLPEFVVCSLSLSLSFSPPLPLQPLSPPLILTPLFSSVQSDCTSALLSISTILHPSPPLFPPSFSSIRYWVSAPSAASHPSPTQAARCRGVSLVMLRNGHHRHTVGHGRVPGGGKGRRGGGRLWKALESLLIDPLPPGIVLLSVTSSRANVDCDPFMCDITTGI